VDCRGLMRDAKAAARSRWAPRGLVGARRQPYRGRPTTQRVPRRERRSGRASPRRFSLITPDGAAWRPLRRYMQGLRGGREHLDRRCRPRAPRWRFDGMRGAASRARRGREFAAGAARGGASPRARAASAAATAGERTCRGVLGVACSRARVARRPARRATPAAGPARPPAGFRVLPAYDVCRIDATPRRATTRACHAAAHVRRAPNSARRAAHGDDAGRGDPGRDERPRGACSGRSARPWDGAHGRLGGGRARSASQATNCRSQVSRIRSTNARTSADCRGRGEGDPAPPGQPAARTPHRSPKTGPTALSAQYTCDVSGV
jgi:hypothetical protein